MRGTALTSLDDLLLWMTSKLTESDLEVAASIPKPSRYACRPVYGQDVLLLSVKAGAEPVAYGDAFTSGKPPRPSWYRAVKSAASSAASTSEACRQPVVGDPMLPSG